jgi:hypothetical protein
MPSKHWGFRDRCKVLFGATPRNAELRQALCDSRDHNRSAYALEGRRFYRNNNRDRHAACGVIINAKVIHSACGRALWYVF